AGGQARPDEAREDRYHYEHQHRETRLVDEQAAGCYVAVGGPAEPTIEPAEEYAERPAGLPFRAQEHRRERGAQGQSVEGRDDDGQGHGNRELLVHPPSDARDESSGHEHSDQNEGDGHHGARHFFHRLQSRLARPPARPRGGAPPPPPPRWRRRPRDRWPAPGRRATAC